jgi:hypothetical protein|tara:strand:- start:1737 stop:1925 length:189 start_codon:yes stop_codon:yes gene_type:complete
VELEKEHGVPGMNKADTTLEKIKQAERYLNSFHGNTSSVKMKKYAINKKIIKMKSQLYKEES